MFVVWIDVDSYGPALSGHAFPTGILSRSHRSHDNNHHDDSNNNNKWIKMDAIIVSVYSLCFVPLCTLYTSLSTWNVFSIRKVIIWYPDNKY